MSFLLGRCKTVELEWTCSCMTFLLGGFEQPEIALIQIGLSKLRWGGGIADQLSQTWMSHTIKSWSAGFGLWVLRLLKLVFFYLVLKYFASEEQHHNSCDIFIFSLALLCWFVEGVGLGQIWPQSANTHPVATRRQDYIAQGSLLKKQIIWELFQNGRPPDL